MVELTLRFQERSASGELPIADFAGGGHPRVRTSWGSWQVVGGPGVARYLAQPYDGRRIPAIGASPVPVADFRLQVRVPVWVLPWLGPERSSLRRGSGRAQPWIAFATAAGLVLAPTLGRAQAPAAAPTIAPPPAGGLVVPPEPTAPAAQPTPAPAASEPAAAAVSPRAAVDAAWEGVVHREVRFTTRTGQVMTGLVGAVQAETFALIDLHDGRVQVWPKADVMQLRVVVPGPLPPSGVGMIAGGSVLLAVGAPVMITGAVFAGILTSYRAMWVPMLLTSAGAVAGSIALLTVGARRRTTHRDALARRHVSAAVVPTRGGWMGGLTLRF